MHKGNDSFVAKRKQVIFSWSLIWAPLYKLLLELILRSSLRNILWLLLRTEVRAVDNLSTQCNCSGLLYSPHQPLLKYIYFFIHSQRNTVTKAAAERVM